ncbi:MAG: PilZ domain-containing protein [Kiritimatiellaeota bacterium]|nr:PilZ domain-containing protein [Kiritimatiellota bacterium]
MKLYQAPDEQRRNRRLFMEMTVGVAVVGGLLGRFVKRPQFEGQTRNVSAGGLELLSDRPIPEGATLKLWVEVATGGIIHTIKLQGTVIKTEPAETPGTFLARIHLGEDPKADMEAWADTIFGTMRARNE